ncbi:MAG: site-2 protease family protein [Hominimerdicola sp.]
MFQLKIKNVKYGISFSFFAAIALLYLCSDAMTDKVLIALLCCAFHELGHIFFMTLFSSPPEKIVVYGGGIRITPRNEKMLSDTKDIIILLAGCGVNFLLAFITVMINGKPDFFAETNILLGIFNLLPFKYFDGGKVLEKICKGGRAYDCIRGIFILMSAIVIIQMNLNGMMNISFILTFVFVAISEFLY